MPRRYGNVHPRGDSLMVINDTYQGGPGGEDDDDKGIGRKEEGG